MPIFTEDEIARLVAVSNAATRGPWQPRGFRRDGFCAVVEHPPPHADGISTIGHFERDADALFAIDARTALPAALARLEALGRLAADWEAEAAMGGRQGAALAACAAALRAHLRAPGSPPAKAARCVGRRDTCERDAVDGDYCRPCAEAGCVCYHGCNGEDEPLHQHHDDPCPIHPDRPFEPPPPRQHVLVQLG